MKNLGREDYKMTLDVKLAEEAEKFFWKEYHGKIEAHDHTLEKSSFMHSAWGISIIATISPAYSEEMGEKFRKILPMEYLYKKEKIPVILSPPIADLLTIVRY